MRRGCQLSNIDVDGRSVGEGLERRERMVIDHEMDAGVRPEKCLSEDKRIKRWICIDGRERR